MEAAGGGQFGAGVEDTGDDQGDGQIAAAVGGAVEKLFQPQTAQRGEDGGDMAVGQGAGELECLVGSDERFALEDETEAIDLSGGPVRKVGEGALADAAGLAEALAQEDGGGGVTVGNGLHVHGNKISHSTI
jgi:hypothetical protein